MNEALRLSWVGNRVPAHATEREPFCNGRSLPITFLFCERILMEGRRPTLADGHSTVQRASLTALLRGADIGTA